MKIENQREVIKNMIAGFKRWRVQEIIEIGKLLFEQKEKVEDWKAECELIGHFKKREMNKLEHYINEDTGIPIEIPAKQCPHKQYENNLPFNILKGKRSHTARYFELGTDQLFVGDTQEFRNFIHQVMFVAVHLPINVYDLPKAFD